EIVSRVRGWHGGGRTVSARRVRAITVRILAQFRHDRRTLALLFVAPIVILGLLDFLLRGSASHPAVGIINLDQGGIGGNVATRLESSTLVSASPMDATAADRGLREGSLAGYVVFAADFSTRAVSEHVLAPQVHLEGSQPGPGPQVVCGGGAAPYAAGQLPLRRPRPGQPRLPGRRAHRPGGVLPGLRDHLCRVSPGTLAGDARAADGEPASPRRDRGRVHDRVHGTRVAA